jgi:hypothetical protein
MIKKRKMCEDCYSQNNCNTIMSSPSHSSAGGKDPLLSFHWLRSWSFSVSIPIIKSFISSSVSESIIEKVFHYWYNHSNVMSNDCHP